MKHLRKITTAIAAALAIGAGVLMAQGTVGSKDVVFPEGFEKWQRAIGGGVIDLDVDHRWNNLDDVAEVIGPVRVGGIFLLRCALLVVGEHHITQPVSGLTSTSSGRSIGVAPSRSAARRVSISTSP